jgi:RNA polymerase sigma factor (TIGR02999 family)
MNKTSGVYMPPSPGEITLLLSDLKNPEAQNQLMRLVYNDLHKRGVNYCRWERPGSSLQATALVNEAYIRLIESGVTFENRAYFFGAAAQAMRRALVDRARALKARKRGGDLQRVDFDDNHQIDSRSPDERLALDEALTALEAAKPGLRDIVNLRLFGGFTAKETADILNLSEIMVRRRWYAAEQWLKNELSRYL